jgi:hypothetical protein
MMRFTFSGEKNSGTGRVPAIMLAKSSIASAFPWAAARSCLQLAWRGFERGEVAGEVVHRQRTLVAGVLVLRHGFVEAV